MNSLVRDPFTLLAAATALLCGCMLGGSAEQGNARVAGFIDAGSSTDSVFGVHLVSEEFNPFDRKSGMVYAAKTGASGTFLFDKVHPGAYYLYAFDHGNGNVLLDGPFTVGDDDSELSHHRLSAAAAVEIAEDRGKAAPSPHFFVRGMSETETATDPHTGDLLLTGVPAGERDIMQYAASDTAPSFFTKNIEVEPGDSITVSRDNRPPRITTDAAALPDTVFFDDTVRFRLETVDPDGDQVTIRVVTGLASSVLDSMTGSFRWVPQPSEVTLHHILFKAIDSRGASSLYIWETHTAGEGPAPTPAAPAADSSCSADSSAVFTAATAECFTGTAEYRFSWGDGDTSLWSVNGSAVHAWTDPGVYPVSVQLQCPDYSLPSAWSPSCTVTVRKSRITQTPVLSSVFDTIALYLSTRYDYDSTGVTLQLLTDTLCDTVAVEATTAGCTGQALYRFFTDGSTATDWITSTDFLFVPGTAGTHIVTVQAWCDTTRSQPSEQSAPVSVVVYPPLPLPAVEGDTTFTPDVETVNHFTITTPLYSGTIPVRHRLVVYNKYLEDGSSDSVFLGSIIVYDACENGNCPDTIDLYTGRSTRLFSGATFDLLFSKPTGIYSLSIYANALYHQEAGSYFDISQE